MSNNETSGDTQEQPEMPADGYTPQPQPEEPSVKSIVGIVIIVIALALGGYYVWNTQVKNRVIDPSPKSEEERQDASLPSGTQGSSDALTDIEADLGTTDLESVDAELENLEAELDATLQSS